MPGRIFRSLAAATVLAAATSGCGFEPLHGASVNAALSAVDVSPIQGGPGELVYRALVERLHPAGKSSAPTYRLEVTLRSTSTPLVIDQSTFVRRYDVHLQAQYQLIEISTGREVGGAERDAHANHGVIPNEIYGTLIGSHAALERAANVLANVIATDAALLIRADQPG